MIAARGAVESPLNWEFSGFAMIGVGQTVGQGVGETLLDSISVPENKINILFLSLLLTGVGVFFAQNLLASDMAVVMQSTPIFLACIAVLFVFYALLRGLRSVTWALVLTYGLLCLVTFGRSGWVNAVFYAIAVIGVVAAIRFVRAGWNTLPSIVLLAAMSTLTILGAKHAYSSFDMLQRLSAGAMRPDPLFHASIAAMIKNYGVVSNGLEGLVVTPYHVLSHILMAGISDLSGGSVLEVYGVATWVLFAPLLIFSIVACSQMLDADGRADVRVAWGVTSVILVALPQLLGEWALWDTYLVSESYMVSLGLLVIGLPLLFKQTLTRADLALIALLGLAIGGAKGSVGLMYVGLWFLRVAFPVGRRTGAALAAFLLVCITTTIVVAKSAAAHMPSQIVLFGLIRYFSLGGRDLGVLIDQLGQGHSVTPSGWGSAGLAVLGFVACHFLISWLAIAWLAAKGGVRRLLSMPGAVYSLGTAGAALLILTVVYIGGDVYYFTNVPLFISLPILSGVVASWLGPRISGGGCRTWLVLAPMLAIVMYFSVDAVRAKRAAYMGYAQKHSMFVDSLIRAREQAPLNAVLHPGPDMKAEVLLPECWALPFIYPAVSERPWQGVIVPRPDCVYQFYSYAEYGITPAHPGVGVTPRLLSGMQSIPWPQK